MTENLETLVAEIEAGLGGVTPGPWTLDAFPDYVDGTQMEVLDAANFPIAEVEASPILNRWNERFPDMGHWADGADDGTTQIHRPQAELHANAAHIARLSPEVVRAILEDRRSLQGEVERLTKERDAWFQAAKDAQATGSIAPAPVLSSIELKPVAGAVTEAMKAAWNACRKSIYAVCEDVDREAEETYLAASKNKNPTSTKGHLTEFQSGHVSGYRSGMVRAAKSIARGFNSMEAEDDDNFRSALEAALSSGGAAGEPPAQPAGEGEAVAWMRRWAFVGIDVMKMPKADRPAGWQLHAVTKSRLLSDDIPLYAPQAPVAHVEGEWSKAIKAIAEGYSVTTWADRWIRVENPDFREDKGTNPGLVIDAQEFARTFSTPPPPANAGEREANDQTVLHMLVREFGGYGTTVVREGERLVGWNPGNRHGSIAIADLRALFSSPLPVFPIPAKEG